MDDAAPCSCLDQNLIIKLSEKILAKEKKVHIHTLFWKEHIALLKPLIKKTSWDKNFTNENEYNNKPSRFNLLDQ